MQTFCKRRAGLSATAGLSFFETQCSNRVWGRETLLLETNAFTTNAKLRPIWYYQAIILRALNYHYSCWFLLKWSILPKLLQVTQRSCWSRTLYNSIQCQHSCSLPQFSLQSHSSSSICGAIWTCQSVTADQGWRRCPCPMTDCVTRDNNIPTADLCLCTSEDWPNRQELWKDGPVKQKLTVSVFLCIFCYILSLSVTTA